MGDDERFEYLYKFVSDGHIRDGHDAAARAHNKRLLDSGTLYAARFSGDSPPEEIDGSGRLPRRRGSTARASGYRWRTTAAASCPG